MLEKVDLSKQLRKPVYKTEFAPLRRRLYDLQKACWDAGIPSVILFEGWDAAGKGSVINVLTQRLDPRGFSLHAIQAPRTYEQMLPWLWRFWVKLPRYGEIGIFDRSWYGRVLVERVEGITPKKEWEQAYGDIVNFERALTDDGYTIMKFFLHISREEQRKRFKKIEKDPLERWRVQPEDWEHHKKYDDYVLAIEEMLERTETEWGPWTILAATDRRWTRVRVFQVLVQRLEEALTRRGFSALEAGYGKPEPDGTEAGTNADSSDAALAKREE